ncbi:MAG: hypothetical protein RI958_1202 [Actinomycetota bacterium]
MHPPDTTPSLLLGIDTGGTFTDAVLVDDRASPGRARALVVASAKAPTTHHDLSIGIHGAIDAVLADLGGARPRIELVSLSTTLATNALVEGGGRRVAAVIIGFDERVLQRDGLDSALAGDPAIILAGGHDPHGHRRADLDLDQLERRIREVMDDVDAFAVMSEFSVRNPEHETAAATLIREVSGKPATTSHRLSARLNGPRRAVTAILNARLIPIIDDLVTTSESALRARGIDAPLMVVRGDGSLVSAAFVRDRPIETILSGPAASLVGAAHLTSCTDAIVSDIGGTTTDIAVLRRGIPVVSDEGATVGGHRTMVTAVAMHTHGLGGDSEVDHDDRAVGLVLRVGPRRVVPISQLGTTHPDLVHAALDRQLRSDTTSDLDGRFIVAPRRDEQLTRLEGTERDLLASMSTDVMPAASVLVTLSSRRVAERLARRGVIRFGAFTPTDASHVLGRQSTYDSAAAGKAAELMARRRDRLGRSIAADGTELAQAVVATLVRRSAESILAAALSHDGRDADLAQSAAIGMALDAATRATGTGTGTGTAPSDDSVTPAGSAPTAHISVTLSLPVVALGASAANYYPQVAALVGTSAVVPEHAAVANAVGAVVGRVRISRSATVSAPEPGIFVVHAGAVPLTVTSVEAARDAARSELEPRLLAEMSAAGADEYEVTETWDETTVEISGSPMFVEGVLTVTASGRPRHR